MYSSSEAHVFARIQKIRERAAHILRGHTGAAPPSESADGSDEAHALAAGIDLRLPRLAELFHLDELAVDAVVCLLAAEFDPFIRLLIRAMQREQGRPYLELGTVAELLDLPPRRVPELARLHAPGGALDQWALVTVDDASLQAPAVSLRVRLEPRVARYLVGEDQLPAGSTLIEPRGESAEALPEPLVDRDVAARVLDRVCRAIGTREPLVVETVGPVGCGKRYFAEWIANRLDRSLLVVDLSRAPKDKLSEALTAGRRDARLCGALLCFARWDHHLEGDTPPQSEEAPSRPKQRSLPPPVLQMLNGLDELVFLTAQKREPLLELGARTIVHADARFPTPSQRAELLAKAIMRHGATVEAEVDFTALARRFALDPARLAASARAAIELAREREDSETPELTLVDLTEACRRQLTHDLLSVAVRVTSSHRWEDLVIPVDVYYALQEMISHVQHAERVYEDWGFGRRHGLKRGVSALFSGPPGTGKTMCASVIARELDMELFQVDLSRVVSKWIGETEKNLARVFDEAERSNAIILFDEADSLFARRTEVKSSIDRYANLEVNFLLQRMEAFSGVTVLTTNFEDTLDTAFKRRLSFRVRFEKPDAQARAALWEKVFPASCAREPDVSFPLLGELYEMSGGNIRNAALRAAFLAAADDRPIDMATVRLAAERECREMGLLVRSQTETVAAPPPPPKAEEPDEPPPPEPPPAEPQPPTVPRGRPRLVPVTHPRR